MNKMENEERIYPFFVEARRYPFLASEEMVKDARGREAMQSSLDNWKRNKQKGR